MEQDGKLIDFGFTPTSKDDLNKFLVLRLKKNQVYQFTSIGEDGQPEKSWDVDTGNENEVQIKLEL